MSSTATRLFAVRNTNFERANPVRVGAPELSVQLYRNWLASIVSGSAPVPASLQFAYDQVRASATLKDNGLTAADVAGATINGVDATATYATSINNTLALIKNKINAGGDTPNDLITKAVSATRFLQDAYGYFTHASDTPGTVTPQVDGTAVPFTAVGVNATDAAALAAAINAQVTASQKVVAYTDGTSRTYVVADGSNRATISNITGLTAGRTYGVRIAGVLVTIVATGTAATDSAALAAAINANPFVNGRVRAVNATSTTVVVIAKKSAPLKASGTGVKQAGPLVVIATGSGSITANIAGFDTSVTWATSDAATATALAAAINANTDVTSLGFYALNVASGVVLIQSRNDGDQMPAIGARGTNITVGGVTTPQTTITIATGSGTIDAYVNGVNVASITATGTDATDAAALAAAINVDAYARQFVVATSALGIVTVTSSLAISLEAVGGTVAVSSSYLTGSGTYGGIAGNALTLTSNDNATRSGATLANGQSGVVATATQPGVAGNWITFAAAGAAAAHVTASGARLGASPAGLTAAGAESVATFTYP